MTKLSCHDIFGKLCTSYELSDVQTIIITCIYNYIISITYCPCFGDVLSITINLFLSQKNNVLFIFRNKLAKHHSFSQASDFTVLSIGNYWVLFTKVGIYLKIIISLLIRIYYSLTHADLLYRNCM